MMVGIIIRNKVEQTYNHQPDHHWHCCPLYPWLKWLKLHECCLKPMTNHIIILPSLFVLYGFMVKMATGLSPWEWTNKITTGHNQSQPSGSLRRLPSSVAAAPSYHHLPRGGGRWSGDPCDPPRMVMWTEQPNTWDFFRTSKNDPPKKV